MTDSDAPQSAEGCPDGEGCLHGCVTGCWRVAFAKPITRSGVWSREHRKQYGNVVQDGAAAIHWGNRAERVLAFLRGFIEEHGFPPTLREVGDAVGLSSVSSVAHQLTVLEHRGYIRRVPGSPRAITIIDRPEDPEA